jgi:hypothetical protein
MAATTVNLLAGLTAHVPVDRIDIVWGPTSRTWSGVMAKLLRRSAGDPPQYVELRFALKTAASTVAFSRPLKLATISRQPDGQHSFTAVFSGQVVEGVYDVRTRTGWFSAGWPNPS